MTSKVVRFLLSLGLAALIAAGATWALSLFWRAIGGGAMSVHGWIAMALGVIGTVGLAWGLMGLAFRSHREGWDDRVVFRSHREGWDDRVDNSLDPGRDAPDDEPY